MILLKILSLLALTMGSFTDIKKREVPDLVNFGLSVAALGVRLIYSILLSDLWIFIYGVFGFLLGLIIAYGMYYLGQWGGGDSKLLIGMGAVVGFEFSLSDSFIILLINIFFIGAIYGLIWSIVLCAKNWLRFKLVLRRFSTKPKIILARKIIIFCSVILLALVIFIKDFFIKFILMVLLMLLFVLFYLWIFIKCVELSSFYRYVKPEQLTEGDWIAKDIIACGKRLCGPSDLGIQKKQIALLKKLKVKKILIKEGVPFVPAFLLAYILLLLQKEWLQVFLS